MLWREAKHESHEKALTYFSLPHEMWNFKSNKRMAKIFFLPLTYVSCFTVWWFLFYCHNELSQFSLETLLFRRNSKEMWKKIVWNLRFVVCSSVLYLRKHEVFLSFLYAWEFFISKLNELGVQIGKKMWWNWIMTIIFSWICKFWINFCGSI